MKKKIIGSVLVLGIVAAAAGLFVPNAVQKITKESVITSSQLEKAVDISELSTAELIYNGIADKYSDGNLEETECHIAYASSFVQYSPPLYGVSWMLMDTLSFSASYASIIFCMASL